MLLAEPIENAARTVSFWRRVIYIYSGYKVCQLKAAGRRQRGQSSERIREELWAPHHEWAGGEMVSLALDLKGFYLKAGQFLGARTDFVPEQICRQLAVLHDNVPPMSPRRTERVLMQRLGVESLSEVFEWIDLVKPLGSASIAQVHKAKLRKPHKYEMWHWDEAEVPTSSLYIVKEGQTMWQLANIHGVSVASLTKLNLPLRATSPEAPLRPGMVVQLPFPDNNRPVYAAEAAAAAMRSRKSPPDGLVAVKVQYPDALNRMLFDLGNLKQLAFFLSKTELKFDLVSAVTELSKQIRFEFDFRREARVMDTISHNLRKHRKHILVPRSIPGLVDKEVLVMEFVEGVPLPELKDRVADLSERKRRAASRRILSRVAEAYGTMILETGLFQADGHPGNFLVMDKAKVALLDYGQSKQLADRDRLGLARLIVALARGQPSEVALRLEEVGITTEKADVGMRSLVASQMFDTTGRVDPFSDDAPIKRVGSIDNFPRDMFFVLRVCQLLRGMANGLGIEDFSCAQQWEGMAMRAIRELETPEEQSRAAAARTRADPALGLLSSYAVPLERYQNGHAGL